MAKEQTLGITVKKTDDISEWYTQVIVKGGLAEFAPIQGCMIIKPNGYGIWEQMQAIWNKRLAQLGVRNAYFPLFVPESFLKKEESHVEGFKAEVAWIEGKQGDAERYALRPTSETIIYATYSKWIRSYRDLPLKINQWANIVRWELSSTRPFLRTREFLWHEGHNAFATPQEATADAILMIDEYARFAEESLALPQIKGRKADTEKFPGAHTTYTIEGMSPDGKALQNGTSHDLADHFAKVFDVHYRGVDGKDHPVFQTSWGWSTRLIGALVLVHGDDKGMVVPPRVASRQIVVVPIAGKDDPAAVMDAAKTLVGELAACRTYLDTDLGKGPGFRFSQYEMEGIPLRIELGPKDLEKQQCVMVRRDTGEKLFVPLAQASARAIELLEDIQITLFRRAKAMMDGLIVDVTTYDAFKKAIDNGRMVRCFSSGQDDARIKAETAATPRVIPFEQPAVLGKCIFTGKPAQYLCYYARAY